MIATDLCQLHYQILSITYQEFMIKNAKNAWKEKKLGWIVNLLDLKTVDWIIDAKNATKSYTKLTNESIKKFSTLYKFCNGDLDKFFLLVRKGIYPYEYMDSWEKFNENTIPPKKAFYSELNLVMKTMSMLKKYGKYLK